MKPVYAHVDRAACIACGLCQMLAPKLFDYDSEGIASYHPDGNTGTKPVDPADLIDLKIAFRRCRPARSSTASSLQRSAEIDFAVSAGWLFLFVPSDTF